MTQEQLERIAGWDLSRAWAGVDADACPDESAVVIEEVGKFGMFHAYPQAGIILTPGETLSCDPTVVRLLDVLRLAQEEARRQLAEVGP